MSRPAPAARVPSLDGLRGLSAVEAWVIREDWDPPTSWSVWGNPRQPEIFFQPPDMQEIVAGWSKTHG